MKAIVTIPPYAPFLKDVAAHPIVEGFRLNTVMPITEPLEDLLARLKDIAGEKPVWLDLKCRQLRIARGAYFNAPTKPLTLEVDGKKVVLDPSNPKAHGELRTPPWSVLELDHEIELDTTEPVKAYFNDGYDYAYVARVDGNRLIMLDGPRKVCGGGESVNILHPSLKIKGYLTDLDKKYIEAGRKVGVHHLMLSYVEQASDIESAFEINPNARVVAKIESIGGINFVVDKEFYRLKHQLGRLRLMAARGDLIVEVGKPHRILKASKAIVKSDPTAIAASRIFTSLRNSYTPSCADISDIGFLALIGYDHVMVGDDICFNEDSLFSALNILQAIDKDLKSL